MLHQQYFLFFYSHNISHTFPNFFPRTKQSNMTRDRDEQTETLTICKIFLQTLQSSQSHFRTKIFMKFDPFIGQPHICRTIIDDFEIEYSWNEIETKKVIYEVLMV